METSRSKEASSIAPYSPGPDQILAIGLLLLAEHFEGGFQLGSIRYQEISESANLDELLQSTRTNGLAHSMHTIPVEGEPCE